jgi:hypothetical protein
LAAQRARREAQFRAKNTEMGNREAAVFRSGGGIRQCKLLINNGLRFAHYRTLRALKTACKKVKKRKNDVPRKAALHLLKLK